MERPHSPGRHGMRVGSEYRPKGQRTREAAPQIVSAFACLTNAFQLRRPRRGRMYFANREVCALTKALHRCLARLVTSASELQDDSRTRGLPDRLLGGVVEFVVLETVARGGTGALHLCTQLSEKRACIASTWRTNEACHWLAVCCVEGSGQVWARLGHDRSQAERFRRRAVQKASSSESEPFRKRAVKEVQKASSSESEAVHSSKSEQAANSKQAT